MRRRSCLLRWTGLAAAGFSLLGLLAFAGQLLAYRLAGGYTAALAVLTAEYPVWIASAIVGGAIVLFVVGHAALSDDRWWDVLLHVAAGLLSFMQAVLAIYAARFFLAATEGTQVMVVVFDVFALAVVFGLYAWRAKAVRARIKKAGDLSVSV